MKLKRESLFIEIIKNLHGEHIEKKHWRLIPKDELPPPLPQNGFTFYKYGVFRKKPKLKIYSRESQVNYGVISKEMIEILLGRVEYGDNEPFAFSEGLALCFGKSLETNEIEVLVSCYKVKNGITIIMGVGGGGENLTPCKI